MSYWKSKFKIYVAENMQMVDQHLQHVKNVKHNVKTSQVETAKFVYWHGLMLMLSANVKAALKSLTLFS